MGKMKEVFTQQMEDEIIGMPDAEYQDWRNSQESATQEEVQANYDAWWDSLTDEQKQQLYLDQEKVNNDIHGPNTSYGV